MRNVINRSISFDPQLFEKMEERRRKLLMQRSEYITRCIIKDLAAGGTMEIEEVSDDLISSPVVSMKRKARK